jgi:hypothetical protein
LSARLLSLAGPTSFDPPRNHPTGRRRRKQRLDGLYRAIATHLRLGAIVRAPDSDKVGTECGGQTSRLVSQTADKLPARRHQYGWASGAG